MGRSTTKTVLAAVSILVAGLATSAPPDAAAGAEGFPVGSGPATTQAVAPPPAAPAGPAGAHSFIGCSSCHTPTLPPDAMCVFCHTGGGPGPQVYEGRSDLYLERGIDHQAHGAGHGATRYRGCLSCHEPHGRSTIPGSALLREDPAAYVTSLVPVETASGTGFGSVLPPAANQRDFCLDCHGGLARYGGAGRDPLSGAAFRRVFSECMPCHADRSGFGVDADPSVDSPSHRMTIAVSGDTSWRPSSLPEEGPDAGSNSCTLCHDGGSDFPHSSRGDHLSETYGAGEDGLCAACHTDTGSFPTATRGVGLDF